MRHSISVRACIVSAVMSAIPLASAYSDTPGPRFALGPWAGDLDRKVGPDMNARGRNLRGSEFVGQNLERAVFDGCDLFGVRFWDCEVRATSFRGAHLTGVFFDECGAGIDEADFTDAVITGLRVDGATYLSARQLMSTRSYKTKRLQGCVISAYDRANPNTRPSFDFRGAYLEGARLVHGDFSGCDFTDACIDRIEIVGCTMTFKQLASTRNFKEGKLMHMDLSAILASNPDFSGMDLSGTRFIGGHGQANFTEANIIGCHLGPAFTEESLYSTMSYRRGDLSGITFERVDMSGWNLSAQNLTGCRFWGCTLANANFEDAVVTGVSMENYGRVGLAGLTVEQIKSTWNYKHGRMAGVILPRELAEALQDEKGAGGHQVGK